MGKLPSSTESLNGDVKGFGESLSSNGMMTSMNTCMDKCMYVSVCVWASVHPMTLPRIRNAKKSVLERGSGVQRAKGSQTVPCLDKEKLPHMRLLCPSASRLRDRVYVHVYVYV